MDYDLAVIGGGAGGLGAARAGVRAGKRTVLIQDGPIGGDCTFTGCVPSKTLVAAAATGASFGVAMQRVRDAVRAVAATEDAPVLRAEGIDVVEGRARFTSPNEAVVDSRRIGADRWVVATGASPVVPPIPGLQDVGPLTSESVWDLDEPPASLVILGGGAIGCELAQALARLGVEVTIVEAEARVLPREDPAASSATAQALVEAGVDVRTSRRATKVVDERAEVRVELDGGAAVHATAVLVAIGRRPVTDGLEPDAAGIRLDDRGFIETDDHLRTSVPHIFAVGDVCGKVQLTHAADEMARIAVGNAFSRLRVRRFRPEWVPSVTFVDPEVASVGLTEAEASLADPSAQVAELPMAAVDRAIAEGRTDGFLKVVCGRRALLGQVGGGRVLGATVVGPRAGELIHLFVVARRTGMFPGRLALAPAAYPTWTTAVQQVMAQFFVEVDGRRARTAVGAEEAA